ncbi:MAG: hypothetical protein D084_Lepto4C00140G0002 [Leptospirillum sp. Group IV 'UBA BS']|nr:MAG: hypothetical protein D084_Lepto4C00140G0002 [Leptospirillum sp. Group IV 'UBA BS']
MRSITLDTDMFNEDMVSDESLETIRRFKGKTFDLDTMTPSEKAEFDWTQDLINFCRDREHKRGINQAYARASEAEWELFHKRGRERAMREAQREKDSEIAS